MTRRRFIANLWTHTTATLTGDQATHLARVLRAEPGQIYDVVANGFLHRAEITTVTDSEVHFLLHEELESDAALPLHLLLAVFKFDHMEWAIEKATELGIARITPILARRTEKHLAQSAAKRADRWRRIALEASKQSRRTTIPDIADPIPLKQALEQEQSPTRILLSETEQATTLTEALEKWTAEPRVPHPERVIRAKVGDTTPSPINTTHALAIGPEGGWTPEEMALFTQHNWQPVTLGPRILRAETAAIAAIAIASTHLI
jgi:16S rRNA (uracil1498-N3)-methyltransferase